MIRILIQPVGLIVLVLSVATFILNLLDSTRDRLSRKSRLIICGLIACAALGGWSQATITELEIGNPLVPLEIIQRSLMAGGIFAVLTLIGVLALHPWRSASRATSTLPVQRQQNRAAFMAIGLCLVILVLEILVTDPLTTWVLITVVVSAIGIIINYKAGSLEMGTLPQILWLTLPGLLWYFVHLRPTQSWSVDLNHLVAEVTHEPPLMFFSLRLALLSIFVAGAVLFIGRRSAPPRGLISAAAVTGVAGGLGTVGYSAYYLADNVAHGNLAIWCLLILEESAVISLVVAHSIMAIFLLYVYPTSMELGISALRQKSDLDENGAPSSN